MFTVKHVISPDSTEEEEALFTATHVVHRLADGKSSEEPRGVMMLGINGSAGERVLIQTPGSNVYVMNERGSTVATYHL